MRASVWLLAGFVSACTPSAPVTEAAEAAPIPIVSASSSAKGAASSGSPSTIPADEVWAGTYESEAGSLYVVDGGEWAGVKWRGDDAGLGLGEGTMALTLRRGNRRVTGTGSGAVGDVLFEGTMDGDLLTASVLRKDPLDRGFTGTVVGNVSGDQLVGTMRLSLADARVIRHAKFTLTRSKP